MKTKTLLLIAAMFTQLAFAAGREIKVGVSGMVCAFCAQGITKKFKAEPSVDKIDVRLSDKRVTLTMKDGQDLSDDRIKELLQDSGYKVDKIERN